MSGNSAEASPSTPSVADRPYVSKDGEKNYPGKFSDPVFKQISLSNGMVNKMTKEELKAKLAQLRLDTRGVKEVLNKRLKAFYQRQKLVQARVKLLENPEMSDYLLVIDFEATCEENAEGYPHEIIEFPAVLVCTKTFIIVDEFREYCKPRINPILTKFCTSLTGISQEDVTNADYFPGVLSRLEAWMSERELGLEKTFTVVTDGPWDMSRFLHSQCNHCQIPFPKWARKWLNIRKVYRNYYGFKSAKLTTMLESLGMEFEGQQHSGIDDARNIARIAIRLLDDGACLQSNEKIFSRYLKQNKRICIDVVSCSRTIEDWQGDSGEEEPPCEEEVADSDTISYTYNGQYQVSVQKNKKAKSPKKTKPDDTMEDVSDLMYWMRLKEMK